MIRIRLIISLILLSNITSIESVDQLNNYKKTLSLIHKTLQDMLYTQKLFHDGIIEYQKNYTFLIETLCCCEQSQLQFKYEKELWLKTLDALEKSILSIAKMSDENREVLHTIRKISLEIESMQDEEYEIFKKMVQEIAPLCLN